ncbi:MAG: ROK family protein [Verrucomicrobiales bacterium]
MSQAPQQLAIGIDFGGTTVKFGLCSGAQIVSSAEPIDTTAYYGRPPEALIDAIAGRVDDLKTDGVVAVGAGIPGLVDFERGHIYEITNVPGWVEIPFRDLLSERIDLPVSIDNDANCMAFAEWQHGAGQGYSDLLAITLGTGVGGGLIINGRLHRGAQFCAGEIGHTSIDYQRHSADSRMPGIIEKFVGNREIADHAKKLYADAGIEKPASACTPKALAAADDEVALQVWQDVGGWLGIALANAIWLFNPQAIVIGGGVSRAGELLFEPLHGKLQQVLSPVLAENIRLVPAAFGNEAGIIGSAAQALASR